MKPEIEAEMKARDRARFDQMFNGFNERLNMKVATIDGKPVQGTYIKVSRSTYDLLNDLALRHVE